ncbi:nucleoporin protein Ndc1-Nup [Leucosporidium creatinivorum]|uniref:Nucleoporin protein Ndc1-Nup n=1 Tax=Leucosporidium creatinivorum TaxID=106004 RepID=A0A1Y2EM10_9BASI|nr:nucleoporin protein Ndc1-Nup [Leucosporidium creatinivorum]
MATSSPFARPPPSNTQGAPPTTSVSDFLSVRSAPSVLAPSQSYAPFFKIVLQKRLKNMFILTAAAAVLALHVARFDPKELPGSLYNVLPALLFSPLAFLGALPIIVLRKQTITTSLPSTATRFSQLSSLRNPSTLPIFLAYLFGAISLSTSYIWCAGYTSRAPQLGVLSYHEGRGLYVLNERRIFLGLLHGFIAAYATVEHILSARSRVQFDEDASAPIPARLKAKATTRAPLAIRSVLVANALFFSSYILLRQPILKLVVTSFLGSWARPYLYTMLRSNAAYSFTLIARSLASSFLIFVVWEAAHVCFEVYATHPASVSHFSSNPNQCLISGLRSDDSYFQHFAYLELSTLTLTNPERRKNIFTDIKPDSARGAWAEISRESLKLVGTELQRAKGRGRVAAPPSAAAAPLAGAPSSPSSSPSVAIRNENVFKPTKKTFLDTLAASSTPSAAPSAVSSAISSSVSAATSRVPSIFQTGGSDVPTSAAPAPVATAVQAVVGFEEKLASWIPSAWSGSLFTRRPELVVGACVARRREVIWAIGALANLLCASLQEDPYGVAQHDIPKILEAFVRYLDVLDDLVKDLTASAERLPGWEKDETLKEITEQVAPLQLALRNGVREIVTEFEPFLSEFRFPTAIATRLQLLVDWG